MSEKNYSQTQELVRMLYKTENGQEMILTPTQEEIFNLIWKRQHPRSHVMCHTRFGKSFVIALAVLTRIATHPEKWAIVAPSEKKARIIMSYLIEHTFDNDFTRTKLDYDQGESLDRLRRERSKTRITFKHSDNTLGEVFIASADNRNRLAGGDALMGFGAPNVILDEAALVDDDIEAKIFRMLGDQMDNFYMKVGNPFRRNHFLRDYHNEKYFKINADYLTGIREGRLTEDFIEEARKKPHFDILYGNKFPDAEAVDDKGWSFLFTDEEYGKALHKIEDDSLFGEKVLGVDVARGGGNFNVWVLRTNNYAKVLAKNLDNDLMSVVGTTIKLAREHRVPTGSLVVDDTGVGAGVTDRLKEVGMSPLAVKLGEEANETGKYANKRAELHWRMKLWLAHGKLNPENDWSDLLSLKYKTDSQGRLKMMSKEDMLKYGHESPDTSDALMLTFAINRNANKKATNYVSINPITGY